MAIRKSLWPGSGLCEVAGEGYDGGSVWCLLPEGHDGPHKSVSNGGEYVWTGVGA